MDKRKISINEDLETEKLLKTEQQDESSSTIKNHESIFLNKYFALTLMVFSVFGQNFVIDNPAALEDNMEEVLHITNYQFSSFYGFYGWSNVILCMVNGYIIDRLLGCRLAVILFNVLMTIGQLIFAIGAYHDKVILMQIGRVIFGFGGESIYVAIFKYVSRWFANSKQLNMAIALLYCVPNMGSVMNMYVMPLIYNSIDLNTLKYLPSSKCLGVALLASNSVEFFSLVCSIILAIIDKKKHSFNESSSGRDVYATWSLKDIKKFPIQIWFIVFINASFYSSIYPLISNIKIFYMYKYKLSSYDANICNSLVYTIGALISPFIGTLVDKIGYNIYWLLFGILASIGTHCLIAFSYSNPFLNMTILGLCFGLMSSAIFPSVPLIMSEDRLGTAFGIIQSMQNLGCSITSTAIGYIVDSKGYFILELIIINYLCACFISIFTLYIYDSSKDGRLNKPARINITIQNKLQNTIKK